VKVTFEIEAYGQFERYIAPPAMPALFLKEPPEATKIVFTAETAPPYIPR